MSRPLPIALALMTVAASPAAAQTLVRGLELKAGRTWATVSGAAVDDAAFLGGWSALAGVHWPRLSPRVGVITEAGYAERGHTAPSPEPAPPPLPGPATESRHDIRLRYASFSPLLEIAVLEHRNAGVHAAAGPRLNVLVSPLRELGGAGPAYRKHVWEASAGLSVRSRTRLPLLLEVRYNHGLSSATATEWLRQPRDAVRHRAFDVLVGLLL